MTESEHIDAAFEHLEQAGLSATTLASLQRVILQSMDGADMMIVRVVEKLPPIE